MYEAIAAIFWQSASYVLSLLQNILSLGFFSDIFTLDFLFFA